MGYAKNSEILDFLLLNGKDVYAPYAWSGLINRYSVYLSEADDKDFIHKKYLSMAEVLIKNGVDKQKKDGQGFFRRLPRSRWRGSLRSGYRSRVRLCAHNAAKFFAPHCG